MKRKHGLSPIARIERRKTISANGCWETDFVKTKPYPSIKVEGRHVMVHRVAYESYVGPIPEGLWVLHKCDNPRCHNPDHLFLGTRQDNIDDMMQKGRHVVAPRDPKATDDEVAALAHLSQAEIGRRLGISQTRVSGILRRLGEARGRSTTFGKTHTGEKHPRAKLTVDAVVDIRASSETLAALAERYGVSPSTIQAAKAGTNWNLPP